MAIKDVQITLKVESDLRDLFAAEAAKKRRTPSQMIRELMWSVVENDHEPNQETIDAIDEARDGQGIPIKNAEDMFRKCGIS